MASISAIPPQRSMIARSSDVAVAVVEVMLCVASASSALAQSMVTPALETLRVTHGTGQVGIA
jgi:hypothetical protein